MYYLNGNDYYEILGISRDASKEEIKDSYRELALKFHPDRNKSPDAEEKFKEISEAYAVLSDDEKRKYYDNFGHAGISGKYTREDLFRGVNFDEIFRDVGFGFGGFRDIFERFFGIRDWGWHPPSRGRDIEYGLEITLEEAASGLEEIISVPHIENCDKCDGSGAKPGTSPKTCSKCDGSGQIRYSRSVGGNSYVSFTQIVPCSKCHGEGTIIEDPCKECNGKGKVQREHKLSIKIPAGVESGGTLRLRGQGDVGERGAPAGDLYVSVNIKPHDVFQRRGNDLICEVPISFPQAALGVKINIPTLNGQARLKIPNGTRSGTLLRLKGKGMPFINGHGRGDEFVRVFIQTPTKLTKRQKQLLQEFEKES